MHNRKREAVIIGGIALLVICLVLIQTGISRGRAMEREEAAPDVRQAEIDRLRADLAAALYEAEIEREKLSIILCESGARHDGVHGDGGRSYGIAQFQLATFRDFRKEAGRPELRWRSRDDQLWLLDWALRNGYGDRWTCFSKRKGGTRG